MARTWYTGFETGALHTELGYATVTQAGNVAIESSIVRSGSYSLKVTPASGVATYWSAGTSNTVGYYRFYIRVTARPATTARRIFGANAFVSWSNLILNPNGTIALYGGTTVLIGTSTTALTDTSRWYRIDVETITGSQEVRIDGTVEITGTYTSDAVAMQPIFGAYNDTVADTYTAYFDDISADDSALPGAGSVIMLLPTSLNAAGGWVEGDGAGTTNMAAAVATRPPPGLASASETNATNIENAVSSATDNCDMNMTTYTAAGIGASDIINSVRGIVRHGEDIATNTKAGAVRVVSNPDTGTESTFNFGDDGGAHGSDAAGAGGVWKTMGTVVANSPSVTLGTAPVLRVGKRTATTRVVCVDFMGILVDYGPAVASTSAPPHLTNYYLRNPLIRR